MKRARLVHARAHAKINLDLRVLGTRADGFHELRTVFQSLELHDVLACRARKGEFALRCRNPHVPRDETNLVWQAARSLWKAIGYPGEPRDTVVTLDKQIPVQSGLGGGSADGAAALVALARHWIAGRHTLDIHLLRDLAAGLGADVPFFLWGGTALGLGRGEEIYPLVDLPRHFVVLLIPSFGVSTAEAYAWYDEERASGLRDEGPRDLQVLPVPWPSRAAQMINDLEGPVARRHPELAQVKLQLRQAGAVGASMSGSGSAIYGLFRTRATAAAAAATVRRPGWRVLLTRTLSRPEYERAARPRLAQ
ncbi:MAG TPA: 4-(cytidine 5'-diphospho)-2-C-methyl-D-erythritol kinase [Vicinamibacterales bacterium]|nr:4-(cytidine 5'-diphospho)-2-C-methyl-D-erythritol kinase [Vicinamibacterales bacterium]